jgi:hypothetical protein
LNAAHRLRAFAVSTAVGSGKTKAAVRYIATPELRQQNFIYVAPTIRLIGQTCDNLKATIQESGSNREVALIHSESRLTGSVPVAVETLQAINGAQSGEGQVVIVTTATFLNILSRIERPADWRVILDEAFSPISFIEFYLGCRVEETLHLFKGVFDIDPSQNHRLLPAAGQVGWVKELAAGDSRRIGEVYRPFQPLAKVVSNPAFRCELVMTPKAKSIVEGTFGANVDDRLLVPSDGVESKLLFACYVTPDAFKSFAEVLFMSALFDQTMLFKLWTTVFGVIFEEHPAFPPCSLRDVHTEQGSSVSVGHLLHADDNSSLYNLGRNVHTAAVKETEEGQRVLDRLVELSAEHFSPSLFLLQTNNGYGYETGSRLMPANAVRVPAASHGLNEYQDHVNVAALAVTNPVPQQTQWIVNRTGLTQAETTKAYRIHTTYQAIGRSAIRNMHAKESSKVFLTVGREDAWLLHELFVGSKWLGQVGDMKSLSSATAETRRTPMEVDLASKIETHLEELPPETRRVSSRSLKAQIADDIGGNTWTRAVRLASSYPSGWAFEGQSWVRIDAEYMGFTVQDG